MKALCRSPTRRRSMYTVSKNSPALIVSLEFRNLDRSSRYRKLVSTYGRDAGDHTWGPILKTTDAPYQLACLKSLHYRQDYAQVSTRHHTLALIELSIQPTGQPWEGLVPLAHSHSMLCPAPHAASRRLKALLVLVASRP
jgi:hypothetical protein